MITVMSMGKALSDVRRFLLSRRFFLILILLGSAVFVLGSVMLGIPPSDIYDGPRVASVQVAGVVFFVLLICVILVVSDDITAVFCPFLILCVFACDCYNSFDVFIGYWWLAIPAALSLAFHFIRYRMPPRAGSSIWGIAAVGAAVLLGGLGSITAEEYFAPVTLYYTLSLSFGMIVAYLALRSQLERQVEYDRFAKFAEIMYAMGMFVCLEVLWNCLIRFDVILSSGRVPEIQQHSNFSTFLLFALPYPLYFARQRRLHLVAEVLMLFCLFISGSRGGLVSAVVMLPFLLVYLVLTSGTPARKKSNLIIAAVTAAVGIAAVCAVIRFFDLGNGGFITCDEPRYRLIRRALQAFRDNPLFGAGLGSTANTDIYSPKKGAFYWYHSMPLQLIGSLGIFGTAAYFFQALLRMLTVTRRLDCTTAALGLGYLAVLIMSCFNPGEFVPVPYELMVVAMFAMAEVCSGTDGGLPRRRHT